ncbi:MAG: site-specific DNA-methyltransferase [bacterium]|nr:site-specific DNA-methyltransferase [bacterium]
MAVKIIIGDCREQLRKLHDESVHCVVTSPPYFGLRDYGVDDQIGHEKTVDEYVKVLADVFREVRRVLRKDGTMWLNLGDCYADSWGAQGRKILPATLSRNQISNHPKCASHTGTIRDAGLKPKDLMMMPARVILALQADGWWVRSEIIWAKPNPMPESATDRPTSAHEKVFLLTKSARYFYDAEAVRTPSNGYSKMPDGWDTGPGSHGTIHRNGRKKGRKTDKQRGHSRRHDGFNDRWDQMTKGEQQARYANLRNVWTIAPAPFPEAHFATFPPALVEPCIKAGCPKDGTVLDPFGGSGTVGLVADRLGRDAILIELNSDYVTMAKCRIQGDAPMFTTVQISAPVTHVSN